MRGSKIGWWAAVCCGLALSMPAGAAAEAPVVVAIPGIEGVKSSRETTHIGRLQKELRRKKGIEIQSTRGWRKAVKGAGLDGQLPDDEKGFVNLCTDLKVDAVVYASLEKIEGERRMYEMRYTVYNGGDGAMLGQASVRVPGQRLTTKIWKQSASELEAIVRQGRHSPNGWVPPAPAPPPVAAEPDPVYEPEPEPVVMESTEPETPPDSDWLRLRAGPAFLARTFSSTFKDGDAPGSRPFAEGGIEYESSMAPGIAVEAEVYPAAPFTGSFAKNVGLYLSFSKVFLDTNQEVEREDGGVDETSLGTSHLHFEGGLKVRYAFGPAGRSPEVFGDVGYGILAFELDDNPEYNGARYTYARVGLGGRAPLGTRYLALDARVGFVPTASLGDTEEELGGSVSTSGFQVYGGLSSEVADAFAIGAGVDYTAFNSDISGTGRDDRQGEKAEDRYLGFRLLAGYRF
jgi:opacity protein-like surface antigen